MDKPISIQDLRGAVAMDCQVTGSAERTVTRPAPIDTATPDAIAFYSKGIDGAAARISSSRAGVVLCTSEAAAIVRASPDRTLLSVANPRLAFIRVMNRFFAPPHPVGIHPTAVIQPEARLGSNVYIGPFTYIGRSEIGSDTVVDGYVHVYDNVRVGKRCLLQSHVVLGAASLGLERNESGEYERSPELGGVVIGDDVVIGHFSRVDRGTMADTILEDGVKLDSYVGVGHNCFVGRHAGLASYAWMAGSSRVEERAWVAAHVCLRESVSVGPGATVGMGSVVTKDVPAYTTVYGVPAAPATRSRA